MYAIGASLGAHMVIGGCAQGDFAEMYSESRHEKVLLENMLQKEGISGFAHVIVTKTFHEGKRAL